MFYKEDFFIRCSYFFPRVFQKEIKQSWEIKRNRKKKVIVNVMMMLMGKNKNSKIETKEQGLQKRKRELKI